LSILSYVGRERLPLSSSAAAMRAQIMLGSHPTMKTISHYRVKRPATRSLRSHFNNVASVCVVVMFAASALIGCSTSNSVTSVQTDASLAVLGITSKTGMKSVLNRNGLAADFSQLLSEQRSFPVLPASALRQYVGADRLGEILNRYAESGQLRNTDIRFLMAANLPVSRIVVARLEEDYVVNLPARRESVYNRTGEVLADREKKVLATQRVTRVSASLIDLRNGQEVWNGHFRVDPIAEAATTQYLGSSFSGSLAAAFANTMVNGIRVVRYPVAPTLRISMLSLLREIADKMPNR